MAQQAVIHTPMVRYLDLESGTVVFNVSAWHKDGIASVGVDVEDDLAASVNDTSSTPETITGYTNKKWGYVVELDISSLADGALVVEFTATPNDLGSGNAANTLTFSMFHLKTSTTPVKYVNSADGSDSNGGDSAGDAYATLKHAMEQLSSVDGGEIICAAGAYALGTTPSGMPASMDRYLTIRAADGATCTNDGDWNTGVPILHVKGFDFEAGSIATDAATPLSLWVDNCTYTGTGTSDASSIESSDWNGLVHFTDYTVSSVQTAFPSCLLTRDCQADTFQDLFSGDPLAAYHVTGTNGVGGNGLHLSGATDTYVQGIRMYGCSNMVMLNIDGAERVAIENVLASDNDAGFGASEIGGTVTHFGLTHVTLHNETVSLTGTFTDAHLINSRFHGTTPSAPSGMTFTGCLWDFDPATSFRNAQGQDWRAKVNGPLHLAGETHDSLTLPSGGKDYPGNDTTPDIGAWRDSGFWGYSAGVYATPPAMTPTSIASGESFGTPELTIEPVSMIPDSIGAASILGDQLGEPALVGGFDFRKLLTLDADDLQAGCATTFPFAAGELIGSGIVRVQAGGTYTLGAIKAFGAQYPDDTYMFGQVLFDARFLAGHGAGQYEVVPEGSGASGDFQDFTDEGSFDDWVADMGGPLLQAKEPPPFRVKYRGQEGSATATDITFESNDWTQGGDWNSLAGIDQYEIAEDVGGLKVVANYIRSQQGDGYMLDIRATPSDQTVPHLWGVVDEFAITSGSSDWTARDLGPPGTSLTYKGQQIEEGRSLTYWEDNLRWPVAVEEWKAAGFGPGNTLHPPRVDTAAAVANQVDILRGRLAGFKSNRTSLFAVQGEYPMFGLGLKNDPKRGGVQTDFGWINPGIYMVLWSGDQDLLNDVEYESSEYHLRRYHNYEADATPVKGWDPNDGSRTAHQQLWWYSSLGFPDPRSGDKLGKNGGSAYQGIASQGVWANERPTHTSGNLVYGIAILKHRPLHWDEVVFRAEMVLQSMSLPRTVSGWDFAIGGVSRNLLDGSTEVGRGIARFLQEGLNDYRILGSGWEVLWNRIYDRIRYVHTPQIASTGGRITNNSSTHGTPWVTPWNGIWDSMASGFAYSFREMARMRGLDEAADTAEALSLKIASFWIDTVENGWAKPFGGWNVLYWCRPFTSGARDSREYANTALGQWGAPSVAIPVQFNNTLATQIYTETRDSRSSAGSHGNNSSAWPIVSIWQTWWAFPDYTLEAQSELTVINAPNPSVVVGQVEISQTVYELIVETAPNPAVVVGPPSITEQPITLTVATAPNPAVVVGPPWIGTDIFKPWRQECETTVTYNTQPFSVTLYPLCAMAVSLPSGPYYVGETLQPKFVFKDANSAGAASVDMSVADEIEYIIQASAIDPSNQTVLTKSGGDLTVGGASNEEVVAVVPASALTGFELLADTPTAGEYGRIVFHQVRAAIAGKYVVAGRSDLIVCASPTPVSDLGGTLAFATATFTKYAASFTVA